MPIQTRAPAAADGETVVTCRVAGDAFAAPAGAEQQAEAWRQLESS